MNIFMMVSILAGLLIVLPLLNILVEIRHPANENWHHIREFLLLEYVTNTLVLIFFVALLSCLIGLSSAYLISRYEFKGRKLLSWMLILPLAVPSYIAGYVYADMFSYTGTFMRFLRFFNLDFEFSIMNLFGATVLFTLTLYPYVYMMARSALEKQSASYIESAMTLGAKPLRRFFSVTLPLLRPALVVGTTLVVLETLNDFGLVEYFNVRVFSFAIFDAWFSLGDVVTAIRLSAYLMLIVFFIVFAEKALRGSKRYHIHAKTKPLKRQNLSKSKHIIVIISLGLIVALGFFIPLLQLGYYFVLTFQSFYRDDFFFALLNTLSISIFATFLVIIIALFIANFNRGKSSNTKKAWLKITTLGYAIPGAIIAIAVNRFFIDLDHLLYPLYLLFNENSAKLVLSLSLSMLIFAYVLRFMAIGYNTIEASYDKIGETFTEASYVLKKGKFKTLLKIDLPLLRTGLISASIIVFIDVIKELPLTLILRPANYQTLASITYEYVSEEMLQEASTSALTLILIGSILIYLLTHQKKTKGAEGLVRKY